MKRVLARVTIRHLGSPAKSRERWQDKGPGHCCRLPRALAGYLNDARLDVVWLSTSHLAKLINKRPAPCMFKVGIDRPLTTKMGSHQQQNQVIAFLTEVLEVPAKAGRVM